MTSRPGNAFVEEASEFVVWLLGGFCVFGGIAWKFPGNVIACGLAAMLAATTPFACLAMTRFLENQEEVKRACAAAGRSPRTIAIVTVALFIMLLGAILP